MHFQGKGKKNKTPTYLDLNNMLSFYSYRNPWSPDDIAWLHVS